jgi:homoprotocatechuate degradation regulator HpaR
MESCLKPRIANRNLPQLFLKARECLMAHFRPILNHYGLTDQQWRVLRTLDEHDRLEPREICSLCQIHSASMAGVLARMEALALIQRSRVAGDQRRVVVRLAPKGDQLVREMAPLIDLQYQLIEEAIGTDILADLFSSLETFVGAQNQMLGHIDLPSSRLAAPASTAAMSRTLTSKTTR